MQGAIEAIQQRHSWRDYSPQEIESEKIEELRRTFDEVNPPFGNKPVFAFVDFAGEINRLTTYGFIKGARLFIVGKIRHSPLCWEDYGWSLQYIILRATALGLATCWLGGTFNSSSFAQKIGLLPDEFIPAVSPIGYSTQHRSFRDRAIRRIAGSHKRKPWETLFFDGDFKTPLPQDAGEYALPLAMLRLAPSASNRQPWRVIRLKDRFHFYIQRTPGLNRLLSTDLQRIDMGIAMLHFYLTLKETGITGQWRIEDPDIPSLPKEIEYRVSWERQQ